MANELISIIEFQSTLLVRGATLICVSDTYKILFQSTLLVRGATHQRFSSAGRKLFQSTLLVRGATHVAAEPLVTVVISIHAPRERSDL